MSNTHSELIVCVRKWACSHSLGWWCLTCLWTQPQRWLVGPLDKCNYLWSSFPVALPAVCYGTCMSCGLQEGQKGWCVLLRCWARVQRVWVNDTDVKWMLRGEIFPSLDKNKSAIIQGHLGFKKYQKCIRFLCLSTLVHYCWLYSVVWFQNFV